MRASEDQCRDGVSDSNSFNCSETTNMSSVFAWRIKFATKEQQRGHKEKYVGWEVKKVALIFFSELSVIVRLLVLSD